MIHTYHAPQSSAKVFSTHVKDARSLQMVKRINKIASTIAGRDAFVETRDLFHSPIERIDKMMEINFEERQEAERHERHKQASFKSHAIEALGCLRELALDVLS